MTSSWTSLAPTVLASFSASMVEFVEAMTIVLAVGVVRGWRSALLGSAAAAATLVLLVLLFGPVLQHVPLRTVQVVVGTLLLMFGMRWLRKAILRATGLIPLHDEAKAFADETSALRRLGSGAAGSLDMLAFGTAFKIVMLEGIEVVFIVIAIGAGGPLIVPASLGAGAALLVVIALGLLLHRPLTQIPENALKFLVGILLSAFGTFWVGEGMGLPWLGADWAIPGLVALFLLVSTGLAVRRPPAIQAARSPTSDLPKKASPLAVIGSEMLGLFIDDHLLAIGTLLIVALAWLTRTALARIDGVFLAVGLNALLAASVLRRGGH